MARMRSITGLGGETFYVDDPHYEWDGPAEAMLWAQPPPGEPPSQLIGAARINRSLAEMIEDGKVGFVRLTAQGETDNVKHGIKAQIVRDPYRKRQWFLTIPDPEHAWRVMMDPHSVWWA